jgi:uncharacterized protein (DUF4415 family)
MQENYDFSNGHRGPVLPPDGNKQRITIRLDADIIAWFREQVESRGGGNYQTLINNALRAHVEDKRQPLEETLRRVIREELKQD